MLVRTKVLQPAVASGPHYLEPGFDPATCTIDRLHNILNEQGIRHLATAKKETLVELVQTKVLPNTEASRARHTNVQPSSEGSTEAQGSGSAAHSMQRYVGAFCRAPSYCSQLTGGNKAARDGGPGRRRVWWKRRPPSNISQPRETMGAEDARTCISRWQLTCD